MQRIFAQHTTSPKEKKEHLTLVPATTQKTFADFKQKEIVEYCAFYNKTKHGEYDFLSNFHEHPVTSPKYGTFQCSEGLYQYQKFVHLNDPELKKRFMAADGQQAFDLSRELDRAGKVDPAWDRTRDPERRVALAAMREALLCKFADEKLKSDLIATGSAYLVENCPTGADAFWADNGNGNGKNMLGQLLMEIRKELGGTHGIVPRPAILDLLYSRKCEHCDNCCHFTNKKMFYNYCDAHMTRELKLGHFSMPIHLSNIPDGTGRFLYFKTNEIPGLVEEGARLIAERIKSLGLKNPFFVTPEASTIAIKHELQTKFGIDGLIISKSKKPTDFDTYSVDYCAITSTDKKTLYLDKSQVKQLENKDIVIIDNVCTTGETIRAVYELLMRAGVHCDKIAESIVLFTEGDAFKNEGSSHHVSITEKVKLNLHRFAHLPTFPTDPSVDKCHYRLYSAATIPTKHGSSTIAVFQDRTGRSDRDVIAYYPKDSFKDTQENIVVRVHDACATSELFDSVKCDCKLQLDYAKDYIAKNGGLIIYLNQEGRGIGLGNKIAAYHLQQTKGLDTVMANRALGLPDDLRHYEAVHDVLNALNIKSIRLMTNNKAKVEQLTKLGVVVNGTVPCEVVPQSPEMEFYMATKARKMEHTFKMFSGGKRKSDEISHPEEQDISTKSNKKIHL